VGPVLGVGCEWIRETTSVLLCGAPVYLSGHLLIGRGVELEG